MRIVLAIGCMAVVLAACGAGADPAPQRPAAAETFDDPRQGYSVDIPAGWHRADRPTSATTEPVEILALATYPPRAGNEDCGPLALGGFDADEVLVLVLERGLDPSSEWLDFPQRPAHFAFEPGKTSESAECVSSRRQIPLRDHWFNFTDAGRHFHVLVAIGADAPDAREREAYRMLDGLRFDPSVKPDWPASE